MATDGRMIERYELLEELGRGGMAQVYRARDSRMQRQVAIKLLPREYLHDVNFRARFEREAQTIAALEHPAIVPIHDYGEHDGQPYLVMRFMAGGSLADRIRRGRMGLPEVAAVLRRVAGALDYAHARGVVHRDLKPANLMFDEDGNPYLSDFGIARLADATTTLTKSGVFIGTPAYMSPEQIQGDLELDGRSDVYALGIILFEMLTSEQPYRADTPAKVMMKHVLDPVPQLRDLDRRLLPAANQVVERALAKDREQRFESASELAAAVVGLAGAPPPEAIDALVPASSLSGAGAPARLPGRGARLLGRLPGVPAWGWLAVGLLALGTIGTGSALALGAFGRPTATAAPAMALATHATTETPTASPTQTASPTARPSRSPTVGPVWATIEQDAACRAGPGTDYDVLGYLAVGQAALTYGVDQQGEWWWIQYPSGSLSCWISASLVGFAAGTPDVPAFTPGPTNTPPPRSTETPRPASGPSATPTPTNTPMPPPDSPTPTDTPSCPEEQLYSPRKLALIALLTPCP